MADSIKHRIWRWTDRHSDRDRGSDAGIIIELKYAQTFQGLSKACENAMRQIRERRYDERLRNEGRNDILAYGIAFARKM